MVTHIQSRNSVKECEKVCTSINLGFLKISRVKSLLILSPAFCVIFPKSFCDIWKVTLLIFLHYIILQKAFLETKGHNAE
jgi:hypothetical protein